MTDKEYQKMIADARRSVYGHENEMYNVGLNLKEVGCL